MLFVFNTLGTPTDTAIQRYLNEKKVPQLFVATGAAKWGDHKQFLDDGLAARPTRPRAASTPNIS